MEEENKLEQLEQQNNTESVETASQLSEESVSAQQTVDYAENTSDVEKTVEENEVKGDVLSKTEIKSEDKELKPPRKSRKEIKEEKERARLAEFEGLSDDELYTKLQTEKMLRRKQNNRIATISGLCALFALAVVVIILAVVPVSLVPRYLQNDFVYMSTNAGETENVDGVVVKLSKGNTTHTIISKDEFDKFKKVFDKSFSQSYINAIFSGNLSRYVIEETWKNESTVLDGLNNKYVVSLDFKQNQEFTYSGGAKYVSKYAGTLTFKRVYITVNEKDGFQDTKLYVVANNYKQNDKVVEKVVEVTIRANTYEIFDQWNEFVTD